MASTEQQVSTPKQEYLTKKVMVNGQFVTLYSLNGQTWLSSPEEIPEVMARLENSRITLAEAAKEGSATAASPEAAKAPDRPAAPVVPSPAAPPTTLASKYRIKGPKPRPILKQNGLVIKGTPVEPFSASEVQVSPQQKAPPKAAKDARAKLKAPVRSEKEALQAKSSGTAPKGKKLVAPTAAQKAPAKVAKEAKLPVGKGAGKPVRVPAAQAKAAQAPKILKGGPKKAPVTKKSVAPKGKTKPAAVKKPKTTPKKTSKR